MTSKSQLLAEDTLVLFRRALDNEDRSITETSPLFQEVTTPWVLTERKFDIIGDIIHEIQTDESENKLSETVLSKELCSEKQTETGFRSILCKSGNGDTLSNAIPNEYSSFKYGFAGEVLAITPFEHTYVRNDNGDIVESSSKSWGKFSRVFNYNENSVSYSDGIIESQTPYGEFKFYTNNLKNELLVRISANYEKRLMHTQELILGTKKFLQTYSYSSSRNLIGKKEFNISWNYQLDSFDRIAIEKIKDTRNDYSLQYNRKNGLVTDIAPYITHIEYSPRLLPILIEYANGVSAEYEYGPRGELLSYSLTKGMVVFYNVKYQYRSDLKLISQSVITNTQLDKQVQNFSYDNLFEVAQKKQPLNHARDQFGQVENLSGTAMTYHHLNLIQIDHLVNFYGESNRYIESCDQAANCLYKISPSEVEFNGEIQKRIDIGGMPVGILYQGHFYPVIPDHKMAVIGLMNTDGAKLAFVRTFDEWGNLIDIKGDRSLEKTLHLVFLVCFKIR